MDKINGTGISLEKELTVEEMEHLKTKLYIARIFLLFAATILAVHIATWATYINIHAFAPDILISTFGSEELAKLFYDRASFVIISLIIIPGSIFLLSSFFRELVDEIREQKTIVKAILVSLWYNRAAILALIVLVAWIYFAIHLFFIKS